MQAEPSDWLTHPRMNPLLEHGFRWFIGRDLAALHARGNWLTHRERWVNPTVTYPDYYTTPAFHGLAGGYLTEVAALTYDPVTAIASPPHEGWVRRQMLRPIQGQPHRILDLGCGTGSTTHLLQRAFPDATITGLDLSPDMLVVADYKAPRSRARYLHQSVTHPIQWQHGLAEATELPDHSQDLVSIAFLFHELPPAIAQQVLQESWRILRPGGQIVILDGSQRVLRRSHWLIDWFHEPYSKVYAAGNVDDWLAKAGFDQIQTHHVGFIHQLSWAQAV